MKGTVAKVQVYISRMPTLLLHLGEPRYSHVMSATPASRKPTVESSLTCTTISNFPSSGTLYVYHNLDHDEANDVLLKGHIGGKDYCNRLVQQ